MSVTKYQNLLEDDEETFDTAESMDPELYRATIKGDILEFFRAMHRESLDQHEYRPAPCVQLGPQKNTVLHLATNFKHHEIVKLICKDLPFYIAEKNAKGDTALHIAARSGDQLLTMLLVNSDFKEGALGEKNEEGNTALHEALKCGHEEVARILINKNRNLPYPVNKEGKSLLYLAAEAGFVTIVKLLIENPIGNYSSGGKHKNKSPVFAAIHGRNIDVLKLLWYKDRSSFQLRNNMGKNPLHVAVCAGFTEGVKFLLNNHYEFAYQKDKQACYPIHSACTKGFLDIVKLLLQHRPDMTELLNAHDQNILHISAKSGKCNVMKYLLRLAEMEKLVNAKDEEGNTPLHLATSSGYPNMAVLLAKHEKTILRLANNHRHTALDIADEYMEKGSASFQKRLTWIALKLFGVPRARQAKSFRSTSFKIRDQQETESWRDKINIILLVAAFIATVTFQAGLTVPGGYNNTNPDQGIATLLEKVHFQEFVMYDAIAMYSSIIVVVTLLWAQQGGPGSMDIALKLALPLLGIALVMMSLAFTAGVYLVVSKLNWLAKAILMMGSTFIILLFVLFVPLCFLSSSDNDIFRRVSHYPFCLAVYALGR